MSNKRRCAALIDIDGVLVRGGRAVAGALTSLRRLHAEQVPFVFLTNSGGQTEDAKLRSLRRILLETSTADSNMEETIDEFLQDPKRVITATSPFAEDEAVCDPNARLLFVTNPPDRKHALELAAAFGVEPHRVVTVNDIRRHYPQLWPSRKLWASEQDSVLASDDPVFIPLETTPVHAVLITQHPPDWGEALQVIVDIVRGGGQIIRKQDAREDIGTAGPLDVVRVLAGNPDIDYVDEFEHPRFTLGAFTMCLERLYEHAVRGSQNERPLQILQFGKPFAAVYEIALSRLRAQIFTQEYSDEPWDCLYCIGDNPASDVRGAKAASQKLGLPFTSVLTKTGVFVATAGICNDPHDPAEHVLDSIVEAVDLLVRA